MKFSKIFQHTTRFDLQCHVRRDFLNRDIVVIKWIMQTTHSFDRNRSNFSKTNDEKVFVSICRQNDDFEKCEKKQTTSQIIDKKIKMQIFNYAWIFLNYSCRRLIMFSTQNDWNRRKKIERKNHDAKKFFNQLIKARKSRSKKFCKTKHKKTKTFVENELKKIDFAQHDAKKRTLTNFFVSRQATCSETRNKKFLSNLNEIKTFKQRETNKCFDFANINLIVELKIVQIWCLRNLSLIRFVVNWSRLLWRSRDLKHDNLRWMIVNQ